MISYKRDVLERQSLSEVKMGRGSPICERVRKKMVEYFKKVFFVFHRYTVSGMHINAFAYFAIKVTLAQHKSVFMLKCRLTRETTVWGCINAFSFERHYEC